MRFCGGWEALTACLKARDRAFVAVRIGESVDELRERARLADAENRRAIKSGCRDPAMVATAATLLAELSPAELRPVLERLILRARDRRWFVETGDGAGI